MPKILPSCEELCRVLRYDEATGELTWRERDPKQFGGSTARCRAWNARYAGKPALNHTDDQGYNVGNISGYGGVKAHRVIWKMTHGAEADCIDHINGSRSDNRLCNLRSVSHDENARNLGLSRNNTSGVNGVYWYPRYSKWMASIRVGGRRKNLGYFSDIDDAISARRFADEQAGYSIREQK